MEVTLPTLLQEIRSCEACRDSLPHGPRPILSANVDARILIIGQAPGRRVHESGIAWNDPSGVRLREWMGISSDDFYDSTKVALVPMGFCYPGTGPSGDLPPRKECAELWHDQVLARLINIRLTLTIGRYAQDYRLGNRVKRTLTETVKSWEEFSPEILPLPHPSPRNNRWLKINPWFVADVVPWLQRRVSGLLVEN